MHPLKKQKTPLIITIDGPAGSGKSTVSQKIAEKFDLTFLATGYFYRGLAILCNLKSVDIKNESQVSQMAHYSGFKVVANSRGTRVYIDSEDVTDRLHDEATAFTASQISAYPQVRAALLEPQRSFNKPPGVVAEGRDCGTVVFPQAQVKIYLTASLDARAQRRTSTDKSAIANRDKADSQRKAAPMAKAKDAVEIDTSSMTIEDVVDQIEEIVRKHKP